MNDRNFKGKRYICMVRASNATEELSTDAQLKMLNEWAQKEGMIYTDKMVLDGVTGSLPGLRKDLEQLLERKRTKNDFDILVVQRLDRLTRSGSTHGFWFEHECHKVGIELVFIGDDVPHGRYANLIKVAKYDAAQEQAFSISQRSTQGAQFALEQGRNIPPTRTSYGCWRLYCTAEGTPSHIIRDLRDGRQQKLHPQTHEVIDTYGQIGGGNKGHYRKQKSEKPMLMLGDAQEIAVVREIFHLHFISGMGGKRIADVLNRKGVRSPMGKQWSQHQVECIYEQEAYTGRCVGNHMSKALYHERKSGDPKVVELDPMIRATAENIPWHQRPREEWLIQDQPLLVDFLEPNIRKLAMAEHERLWAFRSDPNRPKQSKSKHKASDYLLSGLLFAKQDGEPLTGILCGTEKYRSRHYRHRRGRRDYLKGSIFNNQFRADILEKAVIELVAEILGDMPRLREQVIEGVVAQSAALAQDGNQLDDLRKRRAQLKKRAELIASTLDEETRADAQGEVNRLRIERRSLDEQIAAAEQVELTRSADPQQMADAVLAQMIELPTTLKTMPPFALRQVIGTFVERVIGDMETKDVEVVLSLPAWALAQQNGALPMRLVGNSASSTSYETHQRLVVHLGIIDCKYIRRSSQVCYACQRRKAA